MENGIAGLTSFVCLRVMPVQRCWRAVRSGTYTAVFFTFFAASFCADRSLECTADITPSVCEGHVEPRR